MCIVIVVFLNVGSSQTQLDMASILGCGFVSGLVASVITQPCDVIKTRVQVNSGPNQGIMTVLKSVTSNGTAIRGLYSGLTPRVMRRTMMAAFTWLFYEEVLYIAIIIMFLVIFLVFFTD